jgi:hypothetical protein
MFFFCSYVYGVVGSLSFLLLSAHPFIMSFIFSDASEHEMKPMCHLPVPLRMGGVVFCM